MTGLPATGKSAIADAIGRALPAPVFSVDPLEATLNRAGITREHRSGYAAYDLAAMLAEAQLRAGQSAVVDAVNGLGFVRSWWADIAARNDTPLVTIATICSDRAQHRRQLEQRDRNIDGFLYDVTWADVEAGMSEYEPPTDTDLVLDAISPLAENIERARHTRHGSASRAPGERGRVHLRAPRSAALIAEVDVGEQGPAAVFGVAHDDRIDRTEHQLGPPEHRERPVGADVAPGEVEEALAGAALDRRTAEVEVTVRVDLQSDLDVPRRARRVTGHEPDRILALLHPDVDVVQDLAVRDERSPGQVATTDANPHDPIVANPCTPITSPDRPSLRPQLPREGARRRRGRAGQARSGMRRGTRRRSSTRSGYGVR